MQIVEAVKGILYLFAALFMVSVIFVFTPWDTLNAFMHLFGPAGFPADPTVQYTVKNFFLIMFWFGLLLAIAVRRPERHGDTLLVLGGTCLSAAVLCLALGWTYGVEEFFYIDAVSAAVTGLLILFYRSQTMPIEG